MALLLACSANTLLHAIRVCLLFHTQRHTWLEHLSLRPVPQFGDAELLRWNIDPRAELPICCQRSCPLRGNLVSSRDPCVKAC